MLTIMCGFPGSGKSTYAKSLVGKLISTDDLREFITGSPVNLYDDALVFRLAEEMVKYYLAQGQRVILDATNLSKQERRHWVSIAASHPVTVMWIDCPFNIAMERNSKRQRTVPSEVMHSMSGKFERPSEKEGVTVVRIGTTGE